MDPDRVKSKSGKRLANSDAGFNFIGNTVHEPEDQRLNDALTETAVSESNNSFIVGALAFLLASAVSNRTAIFSRLIQIVDFCCLLELLNFKFDPVIGRLLRRINDGSGIQFLTHQINDWASGLRNSLAGPWRGKLSEVELSPYLLQEIGFLTLIMIVRNPFFQLLITIF